VALWVKKTTISAFIISLKASFLVKEKPLLPIFVSHVTSATSEDAA